MIERVRIPRGIISWEGRSREGRVSTDKKTRPSRTGDAEILNCR